MTSPASRRGADPFEPVFTLASGPSGATPATLAALGRPVLFPYDPAFLELYADTVELLRRAFGTRRAPVILHGEAVLGLEAAAASLIRRGDVVLNLVSGVYGKGYGHWAARYAREVIEIEVAYDSAVPAGRVRAALAERPDVTVVSVVHCETPSGTMNDLDAIGPVVSGHGAADRGRGLLLRRHPVRLRRLGCRPGRGRAAEVPGRTAGPVAVARERRRLGPHGGQPGRAAGVRALDPGLEGRPPGRPAVPLDEREVRARARAESGVMLSGGQGALAGQVLQIGHMGPGAYPLSPVIALTALGRALRGFGVTADVGGAVEAALTALDASGELSTTVAGDHPCLIANRAAGSARE
ncbi:MAG TPA: hypothetical protein VHY31_05150 [Streptosporangiaceae bacterium]|nr:hypothetical protein [Streptosporangiaceae bacterium]